MELLYLKNPLVKGVKQGTTYYNIQREFWVFKLENYSKMIKIQKHSVEASSEQVFERLLCGRV